MPRKRTLAEKAEKFMRKTVPAVDMEGSVWLWARLCYMAGYRAGSAKHIETERREGKHGRETGGSDDSGHGGEVGRGCD